MILESTSDFVKKVQATQHKAEINKRRRGNNSPAKELANKQHSTNK